MESYHETDFRGRVDAALKRIRTLLENTRNPRYAADVPHRYDDKYHLVEFLGRAAIASLVQCLQSIGLSHEHLGRLREEARTRSVTLRLKAQEDCRFLREQVRKVESAEERVTERRGFLGTTSTTTEKVITTVTEYHWSFEFEYALVAFVGNLQEQPLALLGRRGALELRTAANSTPRLQTVVRPALDVDVTWLLRHLDPNHRATFAIDRTRASCHTPRRNHEVEEALRAFEELYGWCGRVRGYFLNELFTAHPEHGLDLSALTDREVFNPVLPLFESSSVPARQGNTQDEGLLPLSHLEAFLAEEQRSLASKCMELGRVFPRDASVVTAVEAGLLVILQHAGRLCQHFLDGVTYVEEMLRRQLVAAIGKELGPADFTRYMDFHHRKLVRPAYRPLPFSHAVRRPDHDPEGVLSLEADAGGAMPDPVLTTVTRTEAVRPMYFALDAATRVAFLGDRYLHGWVSHQFSGSGKLALNLVARARQYSSFILLVGRIASAELFEPRYGIIVQNKDLLKIPLMLEQLPTPKEFRDAIESLSPEQQRFARAFRGMQLESTLFGVCVLQLKPQLERLLKLPPDSLTKEIKLTQDLTSLFLEYQIPSDLLSYDGPAETAPQEKLRLVKEYVARMQEMISLSKQREIEEAREREALRLAEMNQTPMAPPSMGSFGYAPDFSQGMAGAAPIPPPMAAPAPGGPPRMPAGMPNRAPPPAPSAGPPPARRPPPAPVTAAQPMAPPQPAQAARPPEPAPAATKTEAAARPPTDRASGEAAPGGEPGEALDYTRIPAELDRRFDALDEDSALRPTIINPGELWTRSAQRGLLASPVTATLAEKEQKDEKNRAFDLLDALTKSGALTIEDASLHVVIAATHCFDRTLTDTVIQGNVNPIEKVERSLMIVATTIHRRAAVELLADDQRERFLTYAPRLGSPEAAPRQLPQAEGDPQEGSSGTP